MLIFARPAPVKRKLNAHVKWNCLYTSAPHE
jgi:hypothetical protein